MYEHCALLCYMNTDLTALLYECFLNLLWCINTPVGCFAVWTLLYAVPCYMNLLFHCSDICTLLYVALLYEYSYLLLCCTLLCCMNIPVRCSAIWTLWFHCCDVWTPVRCSAIWILWFNWSDVWTLLYAILQCEHSYKMLCCMLL
jgi:hypothetical protein